MKARVAKTVALGFCFMSALAFPSTAVADAIGWNPFLYNSVCSTCGPLTPLTLEQADTVDLLFTDFADALVPPPTFVGEPGPAPAGGGGGSPSPLTGGPRPTVPGGQVPAFSGTPSGPSRSGGDPPSGGGAGAGGGGLGAGGGGVGAGGGAVGAGGGPGNGLGDGVTTGNPFGLDYGVGGLNSLQNDAPFSFGESTGALNITDTVYDAPVGQAETVVPEPATLFLLGSGLSAAAFRRRRRRNSEQR